MHTIALLRSEMFDVSVNGARTGIAEVLPQWNRLDRLGLVIDSALGGLGASHLVQIAITSFYESAKRRQGELTVYPEIYAFHVGKGWGSHAAFDFWPARREVMVSSDPKDLLDAINDRGITRLVVPDRPEVEFDYRPKEVDTALDRIVSAFAYHPGGRTDGADVAIRGNDRRTEINPTRVLRPVYLDRPVVTEKAFKESDTAYVAWLKLRAADITPEENAVAYARRQALVQDGVATETYRRIGVAEALARMASRESIVENGFDRAVSRHLSTGNES